MAAPTRISVVQLTPGTSATPGAQAITVPSDAIGAVVLWGEYGAFLTGMVSITSTFGTFSLGNVEQTPSTNGTRNGAGGWWCDVTATGSQTLTPIWGNTIQQGPLLTVVFYKDIAAGAWVQDMVSADSAGSFPLSINSAADNEVLFIDTQDGSVPATNSGCTSIDSRTELGTGGRIQTVDAPGASTTPIPTTSGNPATFAISVIGAVTAPTITVQPINQRVPVGDVAAFSVSATGTGTLTYQWQDNTSGSFADITGETSSTYSTGTLTSGEAYEVRCVVTDSLGSTNSNSAQVWTPPVPSHAWAGMYSRSTSRDMVRLAAIVPNSDSNILIGTDALFGTVAAGTSQTIAFTLEDVAVSVSQTATHPQSLTATLDGVSVSIAQTLTHSQALAATLDGVTVSIGQTAQHPQSLAITLDDVDVDINQSIGAGNSQAIAFTLDDVVLAIAQTANHPQSLAATLDGVTVAVSQVAQHPQALAITLDGVSVAINQGLRHSQALAITLDGVTVEIQQSASPAAKDQSLAFTLDDVGVLINQIGPVEDQADDVIPTYIPGKPKKPKERKLMGGPRWQRHELEDLRDLVQVLPFDQVKQDAEEESQKAIQKAVRQEQINALSVQAENQLTQSAQELALALKIDQAIAMQQLIDQQMEDEMVMQIIAEML